MKWQSVKLLVVEFVLAAPRWLGVEFGHDLDLHVTTLQLPLVVLLQQDGLNKPNDGLEIQLVSLSRG
jgi:hypothetical protein